MNASRLPGGGAKYRSNCYLLRFTIAAVAWSPFGGSKRGWFRTDALQVRNRVSPPKSMRASVAAISVGTMEGLAGRKGLSGLLAMLRIAGIIGSFRRGLFESGFLRSKNCRVAQPPENANKPMAVPRTRPPSCQTGFVPQKPQTKTPAQWPALKVFPKTPDQLNSRNKPPIDSLASPNSIRVLSL